MSDRDSRNLSHSSTAITNSREEQVAKRFENSTEKERIAHGLKLKLAQCKWRDEMMNACAAIIQEKGGVGCITLEELISEMKQRSLEAVPAEIKVSTKKELANIAKQWMS